MKRSKMMLKDVHEYQWVELHGHFYCSSYEKKTTCIKNNSFFYSCGKFQAIFNWDCQMEITMFYDGCSPDDGFYELL